MPCFGWDALLPLKYIDGEYNKTNATRVRRFLPDEAKKIYDMDLPNTSK